MDRRSLLAMLAAGMAAPKAFAQAAAGPRYVVLSLLGDELTEVGAEGDRVISDLGPDRRARKPTSSDVWDVTALQVIAGVVPKAVPDASMSFLKGSRPEYFFEQVDWFDGDVLTLPDTLKAAVDGEHAAFLLLLTKWRGDAIVSDGTRVLEQATLAGLGFYLDPSHKMGGGSEEAGFTAPYVYARLSLVDLSTLRVVRESLIHRAAPREHLRISNGALQDLLIEGVQDAATRVLAASSARMPVQSPAPQSGSTVTITLASAEGARTNGFSHAPYILDRRGSCDPEYPAQAIRAEAQGQTVLQLQVDASGHLGTVDVVQSAGNSREHRLLDEAAKWTVVDCRFAAARDAVGHRVAGSMNVTYDWTTVSRDDGNQRVGVASVVMREGPPSDLGKAP